jgi:hypothetical protein
LVGGKSSGLLLALSRKSLEVAEEKALTREEKYQVSKRPFLIGWRKVIWSPIGSFQKEPGSGRGKGFH